MAVHGGGKVGKTLATNSSSKLLKARLEKH